MDADLVLSSRSVDNVAVHSKRMTWRSLSGVDCRHICPPPGSSFLAFMVQAFELVQATSVVDPDYRSMLVGFVHQTRSSSRLPAYLAGLEGCCL
jgi:hypothetical protein